jgi:hypothetical protein
VSSISSARSREPTWTTPAEVATELGGVRLTVEQVAVGEIRTSARAAVAVTRAEEDAEQHRDDTRQRES